MHNIFLLLLAIAAGAALPMQAALNTKMGHVVTNPVMSGFISFLVGAIGLLIYMLIAKIPLGNILHTKQAPPHLWLAGILGAFYVTSVIILVPKLGVALTFGLVIGGQMLLSLLIDHFGLFGVPVHQVSLLRIAGIALIIAGVVLIRKF